MAHNVFAKDFVFADKHGSQCVGRAMPPDVNTQISLFAMPSSPTAQCWTMQAEDERTQGLQRRFQEGGFHVPRDQAILMQLAREHELNEIVATGPAYWRRIGEIFDQAERLFGEDGFWRLAARIPRGD